MAKIDYKKCVAVIDEAIKERIKLQADIDSEMLLLDSEEFRNWFRDNGSNLPLKIKEATKNYYDACNNLSANDNEANVKKVIDSLKALRQQLVFADREVA